MQSQKGAGKVRSTLQMKGGESSYDRSDLGAGQGVAKARQAVKRLVPRRQDIGYTQGAVASKCTDVRCQGFVRNSGWSLGVICVQWSSEYCMFGIVNLRKCH